MKMAALSCRDDHSTPDRKRNESAALGDFVVYPGESLEESLSRAISHHILGCSFSEILRVVTLKRLESMIDGMELNEMQREKVYELFSLATTAAKAGVSTMYRLICRGTVRKWLERNLPQQYMIAIKAYEHHLARGEVQYTFEMPEDALAH